MQFLAPSADLLIHRKSERTHGQVELFQDGQIRSAPRRR